MSKFCDTGVSAINMGGLGVFNAYDAGDYLICDSVLKRYTGVGLSVMSVDVGSFKRVILTSFALLLSFSGVIGRKTSKLSSGVAIEIDT